MFQAVSGERIELNSEDELRERAAPREPIAERKRILEAGRLDRNPCASVRKPLGQLYDLFAAFRFIALAPAGAAAINDLVKRFGPEGPARAADQLRNLDGITDPNPAPVAALETRLHCRNLSAGASWDLRRAATNNPVPRSSAASSAVALSSRLHIRSNSEAAVGDNVRYRSRSRSRKMA